MEYGSGHSQEKDNGMDGAGENGTERSVAMKKLYGVPFVSNMLEEMEKGGDVWEEEDGS